jgi:drug/metabolite transporter (DMT)-like permease
LLYTAGLRGVPTSVAPIIATIEPVVATVISVTVYNEVFEVGHFLGIVLVLLSVLVLNLKVNKNENKSKCEN